MSSAWFFVVALFSSVVGLQFGCDRIAATNESPRTVLPSVLTDADQQQVRRKAEIAYSSGKFETAIELFSCLIRQSPDDDTNFLWRAQARQRIGLLDDAQADLAEAIRLAPHKSEPRLQRAQLHYARSRVSDALLDCTSAIEMGGSNLAGAYSLRASLQLASGEYERAVEDCDAAIKLDAGFAQAYNNRGLAKQALGDLREAMADFSAALEHHSQLSEAYNNRGALRLQLGQSQEALADLNEAIRLAPLSPSGYDNRSRLLLEQLHDPEQAAKDCTRLIQVVQRESQQRQGSVAGKKTAAIYARRARAHWELQRRADALADCTAAMQIDAGCIPAQELLQELAAQEVETKP